MTAMRAMMQKLKLTVNEAKTHVCHVPDESFDFLGYTIGRCYSTKTGKAYIGTRPSPKKTQRLCRQISEMTSRRWTLLDATGRVMTIHRLSTGWLRAGSPLRPSPERGHIWRSRFLLCTRRVQHRLSTRLAKLRVSPILERSVEQLQ